MEIDCTGLDKIIKNINNWNGIESKLSSEYIDIEFRDYTGIVKEFGRYIYRYSNTMFVEFKI